jgi:hypothetical protein
MLIESQQRAMDRQVGEVYAGAFRKALFEILGERKRTLIVSGEGECDNGAVFDMATPRGSWTVGVCKGASVWKECTERSDSLRLALLIRSRCHRGESLRDEFLLRSNGWGQIMG